MRSAWLRHGVWNTADHATVRVSDALMTLSLIWALPSSEFSNLALAQAVVAPGLMAFVAPEAVIYRDFSKWKSEGGAALAARLHAFRRFGQIKFVGALALAAILASAWSFGTGLGWKERFWALVWAVSLVLAPQIPGADREFLRMELALKELFALTLYQKGTLLAGTLYVALCTRQGVSALAAVTVFSAVSAALLADWRVRARFTAADRAEARRLRLFWPTILDSIRTFSLWTHLSGSIQNAVQSLDLFFLGLFRVDPHATGLYAAALKLANFSTAMPQAASNLFSVWIARRESADGLDDEVRRRKQMTLALFALNLAQAGFILLIAPWALGLLSHGRWSAAEIAQMVSWLFWLVMGMAVFCSTYLLYFWINRRGNVIGMFFRVSLPWALTAGALYAAAAAWGGIDAVARANVAVALAYAILLTIFAYLWQAKQHR